ncbi:MAG: aminopeptidase [Saprospiraceae bacterium]|nr:MAG: aminopeptidase [Saprospiraceae bacterium]
MYHDLVFHGGCNLSKMKFIVAFCSLFLFSFQVVAQDSTAPLLLPDSEKAILEQHIRYIASDEMAGRRTASEGGRKAAAYIAEQFEKLGLLPPPGQDDYFQKIPFVKISPPSSGLVELDGEAYYLGEDWGLIRGNKLAWTGEAVFVGHGWVDSLAGIDDYANLDVKNKVVIALSGKPDEGAPFEAFQATRDKRAFAQQRGAIGLIELYKLRMPWQFVRRFMNAERLEIGAPQDYQSGIFHVWLKEKDGKSLELERGKTMRLSFETEGMQIEPTEASNVVGYLPGTDPTLADEIILLTAHYDHVGVGKQGGGMYTPADSIFNGARDNAIGVVALFAAARAFQQNPPARTVVFIAFTGEEIGLLGSNYYAENPLFPLEKTVYNLNNDGAGYNLTTHFSLIGWGRTTADTIFSIAARETGLDISKNPAENQNLFERSDNISFARKGIPAVTFSPGFIEMDREIMKYYHQAADNPDTLDFDYLFKFWKAYAAAALHLANWHGKLDWVPGDKFAPAGQD